MTYIIEALVVYAASNKIPQICNLAVTTFSMSWQESASLTVNDADSDIYYSNMFDSLYRFIVGSVALIICFAPFLFNFLIQGAYSDAYLQMTILFMAFFFSCLATFYSGIYVAHYKTKRESLLVLLAAIVNLFINILLINKIGLFAASISTLISYCCLWVYRVIDIKNLQSIKYNWTMICLGIAGLMIMSVICFQQLMILNILNLFIGFMLFVLFNRSLINKVCMLVKSKRMK